MSQVVVNSVSVCGALNNVLSSYDHLVEQYELEQRAKALGMVRTVVSKLPSEWEQPVYNISTIVLGNRLVRTFYVLG